MLFRSSRYFCVRSVFKSPHVPPPTWQYGPYSAKLDISRRRTGYLVIDKVQITRRDRLALQQARALRTRDTINTAARLLQHRHFLHKFLLGVTNPGDWARYPSRLGPAASQPQAMRFVYLFKSLKTATDLPEPPRGRQDKRCALRLLFHPPHGPAEPAGSPVSRTRAEDMLRASRPPAPSRLGLEVKLLSNRERGRGACTILASLQMKCDWPEKISRARRVMPGRIGVVKRWSCTWTVMEFRWWIAYTLRRCIFHGCVRRHFQWPKIMVGANYGMQGDREVPAVLK